MGDLRQKSVGRAPNWSKRTEKDIFVLIFVSFHQGKEKRKNRDLMNCNSTSCRRKRRESELVYT